MLIFLTQGVLGGRVFERLSKLRTWMVGKSFSTITDKDKRTASIDPSKGPNLRVFFGPDSTYFAVDGKHFSSSALAS